MKLTAIKDLPNGVKAGEVFDEKDLPGDLLVRLGVARVTEPGPTPEPSKRRYRRRDLQAEDTTDLKAEDTET